MLAEQLVAGAQMSVPGAAISTTPPKLEEQSSKRPKKQAGTKGGLKTARASLPSVAPTVIVFGSFTFAGTTDDASTPLFPAAMTNRICGWAPICSAKYAGEAKYVPQLILITSTPSFAKLSMEAEKLAWNALVKFTP